MEFSAWPSVTNPWHELVEEAAHIERAGWKGLWVGDHLMAGSGNPGGNWQDAWTVLGAIAARVPRIRLGTLVTCNNFRHPCVLARQVAQVDVISDGRVTLGIGTGSRESEHTAFGFKYGEAGVRNQQLEESTTILRSMFDIGSVSFSGKHYRVPNAELTPRPVQERLPILVGGNNTGLLRAVARCADQWNANGPLETVLKRTKVLKQQCEKVGRDMATIHRTANVLVNVDDHVIGGGREARPGWINAHRMYDLVDALTPYAEAGVDEIIVYFNPNLSLPRRKELLTEFMGQVAPAFA